MSPMNGAKVGHEISCRRGFHICSRSGESGVSPTEGAKLDQRGVWHWPVAAYFQRDAGVDCGDDVVS